MLVLAQLLWGVGFGLLGPLWPLHLDALGAGPQDIGFQLGAGAGLAALSVLPLGWLADRSGRRIVLVATGAAGALGAASLVPLTDFRPALLSSVLYWISAAALPVMSAHVASITPRAMLGRAMGLVFGAFFLGNIAGAPAAGALAAALGLPLTIAIASATFVVSTIAFSRVGPGRTAAGASRARPGPAFWAILAVAPVAAFVAVVPTPLLPVYLRDVVGVPLERIGLLTGLFSGGAAVLSAVSGRLADRVGTVPVVAANAAAVVVGALVVALLARSEVAVGVGIFLLGAAFAVNPVMAAALERALPAGRIALAYASFQTAYLVGFAAGGTAAGVLYATDPLLPYIASGALALPAAAAVALVFARLGPAAATGAPA